MANKTHLVNSNMKYRDVEAEADADDALHHHHHDDDLADVLPLIDWADFVLKLAASKLNLPIRTIPSHLISSHFIWFHLANGCSHRLVRIQFQVGRSHYTGCFSQCFDGCKLNQNREGLLITEHANCIKSNTITTI